MGLWLSACTCETINRRGCANNIIVSRSRLSGRSSTLGEFHCGQYCTAYIYIIMDQLEYSPPY